MADDHDRAETSARQSYDLVARISALLSGHDPDVQGAVVAQLFAKFVAGHAPELRDMAAEMVIGCAADLVPTEIEQMIEQGRAPPDWRGTTQ